MSEDGIELGSEVLYLSYKDVVGLGLRDDDVLRRTRAALVAHGRDEVEMPAKIALHPVADSSMHAAPAYIRGEHICGVKWSCGFPTNLDRRLPQITATLIYNDADTGLPLALMDARWITARRTAAVSALACERLARPDSAVVALAGCGVQGSAHVDMLPHVLRGIAEFRLFDVRSEAAHELARQVEEGTSAKATVLDDPERLVRGADVVVSATAILSSPAPFLRFAWLWPGTLVLPVDFDSAWDTDTFFKADKLLVDSRAEMDYFQKVGYLKDGLPAIHAETGEVVAELVAGRENDDEVIVDLNIGMGVEDVSVAAEIYARAVATGAGMRLPL